MDKKSDLKKNLSSEPIAVNYYEHHADLKKNILTPFKVQVSKKVFNVRCNWHDNIELLLFTHGVGMLRYGMEKIEVSSGTLVVINSQTMHSLISDDGMEFCCLIIDNSFFEENGIEISSYSFESVIRDDVINEKCMGVFHAYNNYRQDKGFLGVATVRKATLELIIALCSDYSFKKDTNEEKTNSSEKYIKQAMLYINDNYAEKITLDGIAKVIGINKSYLAREFKKHSGQTVHTYMNLLRCQMADRYLSQGMKVTEAAMASGFESLSYFSRTYKKIRGISPVYTK